MKQAFSPKWVSSSQPRKQRKYRANAPAHLRTRLMSATLSKALRTKYNRRSAPIRRDDGVKIMRGTFRGKTGKVDSVNMKKLKVVVEGIYRTKKDGTKVTVYLDPSVLQIQDIGTNDRKRVRALERARPVKTAVKKTEERKNV